MLQGGIASVNSITAIVGPPLATNLFGYFISAKAPFHLPGAAFFAASALALASLLVARATFKRLPE